QDLGIGGVPDGQRFVSTTSGYQLTIGAEGDTRQRQSMAGEIALLGAGLEVPQTGYLVAAPSEQLASVLAQSQTGDCIGMNERPGLLPGKLPDLHGGMRGG